MKQKNKAHLHTQIYVCQSVCARGFTAIAIEDIIMDIAVAIEIVN